MMTSARLALRALLVAVSILALTISVADGQTQTQASVLSPAQTLERTLHGGETQAFEFPLQAGQFAQVEIEQHGTDVAVSLFGVDGKLSATLDGKGGRLWRETISCLATVKGSCRVEVSLSQKDAPAGSYTIKLNPPRPAESKDRQRLLAERTLGEGRAFYENNEKEKALAKYEEAIALWQEAGDKHWEAVTLLNLGWTRGDLRKNSEAIAAYERALSLLHESKDRPGEGKASYGLGAALSATSQFEKARDYFEQSLVISRELKNRNGEAATLNNLGIVHANLGQFEKATTYFEQVLAINRETKNRSNEGRTLNNLGAVYIYLGQVEKALTFFEPSLAISRELKDRNGESYALGNLANAHLSLSHFEKALTYYQQALAIVRELKDRSSESKILNNSGAIYNNLGQFLRAREAYEQALAISREMKERSTEGLALIGLGNIYEKLNENEKARGFYEQALVIKRESKDRYGEGLTLSGLANIYLSLGQYEKARDAYEQALKIEQETKDRRNEGVTFSNLGNLYRNLGQHEKAQELYGQALAISREIKDQRNEGETLYGLMLMKAKLGERQVATLYGKQAINIYQELRGNIKGLDKESQKSFLQMHEGSYRELADLLIAEGRFPEAQAVLDLLKEEEFKQWARRSNESLFTLPYSSAEEEAIKIIERLASVGRELSELRAKGDNLTADEKRRLNQIEETEIPAANKALRLAVETLAVSAPDVEKTLAARMKENVQNILPALGKGVVALYTVVGKSESSKTNAGEKLNVGWILLVTPEFRKAYPIDTVDLEQTVFKFREALSEPDYDPQPLAQKLYRKLFLQTSDRQKQTLAADLETYLGKHKDKTLMWSLDGVLRYVPMAALHDGQGYLLEKYRSVVFNTASLGTLKDAVKSNWEVLGLGVSEERSVKTADGQTMTFAALKEAESELRLLVREKDPKDTVGILPGIIKLNQDFSKQALFEGTRTNAPVIHIASHFAFNPAKEETSFLLLGDGGKVEMSEFQDYPNLFGNVDLLSLSACDTATGSGAQGVNNPNKTNGKEVEGFAYVAQTLGAKSVMASLWQISDESTKELMLKFYRIRQANPQLPKGEALRQAQLALLNGKYRSAAGRKRRRVEASNNGSSNGESLKPFEEDDKAPYAHPYFWAPFVLIGNWR